jgi:DMSO/TMAO reductase YedYZ molybdopterin-dependent catalytic subunit
MSTRFTRRRLITTGLAAAAGVSGLAAAAQLADRFGLIPPDSGGIYGVGETLTYAAQRVLMSSHSLAREFARRDVSKHPIVNGTPPETDAYQRLLAGKFAGWRLQVDGLVARPLSFSLGDLKRLPSRTQITHQACEEGWSFIAEWTGVALSDVLALAGVSTRAKYVMIYPFEGTKIIWDSLDMPDAFHPQTLLAYGMNGGELPAGHGAPVRLRMPRQLGYKSVKYLSRISVVESVKDVGEGLGASGPQFGYSWYAGI